MSRTLTFAAVLLLCACKRPQPPDPRKGIDVSAHNRVIDWSAVSASGVTFAFIKASEGGDLIDQRFKTNASEARAAGLEVGAYHFFTFCRPGADQAQNFLAVISSSTLSLPPVVDVEYVGNCKAAPGADQIRHELDEFLSLVETATKRELIIYTTPDADQALLGGLKRKRWIRSIGREPEGTWDYWQHDAAGKVPGIEGDVDLDLRGRGEG
ncbi:MAG: GH25 family lysozyme [Archangium sp.]